MLLYLRPAQAQDNATGAIQGTVRAENGSSRPGVTVAALHMPTGIRRVGSSDVTGRFSLVSLLAGGPYVVQVQQEGFRSQVITNIFLDPATPLEMSLTLVPALVAVGTRRLDRTAQGTPVPVDVIDMRSLVLTAPHMDNTQLLNYVVPSFNSNRESSTDGGDHSDGFNLRGLGTDQVLVLVNGHRRHSSALINLLGSRGVGSSPIDLNTLPANALDQVEILRDGAAAQYGSDAIAGVVNLTLKNDNHGGNILVNTGIHGSGFGANTSLSVNKGLALGSRGFLNLTGELDYRGYTTSPRYQRDLNSWPVFSSEPAREDSFLRANGRTALDYRQRNGDARVMNYRAVYNAGLTLSDNAKLYSFATYNYRRGEAVAPWVLPSANPNDLLDRDGFRLGYQPDINTRINDGSAVLGLDARLGQWRLDVSQSLGINRFLYDVSNTINPSMGLATPTAFRAGGMQLVQAVSNATMSRLFDQVLAGTNVAFGGEFRTDGYRIIEGEEASWRDYGRSTPGAAGGSQGFIGFEPGSARQGQGSRRNVAAFLDVEADVTKRWTVGAAGRLENYSDFGAAFIYKVATRVQATSWLALRGAYNTGFRAPSMAQQVYSQLSLLPTATGTTYSGIFNNQSDIARVAGIRRLRAEESRNVSAGLVLTPHKGLTLAADAYLIDIDNRIGLTNTFGQGTSAALDAALRQADTESVQFFANALNTRTRGLDLVGTYTRPLGTGSLNLSLAANFNETRLRSIDVPSTFSRIQTDTLPGNDFIGQRERTLITTGSPLSKIIGSVGYEGRRWGATVSATRFGQVAFYDFNFDALPEGAVYLVFSPKTSTDLLLTYRPKDGLLLALGARNVFNVRIDDLSQALKNGRAPDGFASVADYNTYYEQQYGKPSNLPYDRDILPYQIVQMGANGSFFYLKASYSFGK